MRFALALLLLPAAALAASPVPRTAEEAARIAAVTAPTNDFSKPEPFEARPGGAATVAKALDANASRTPRPT